MFGAHLYNFLLIDMNNENLYFIQEVIGVPVDMGEFDDYISQQRKGGYFEFNETAEITFTSIAYCC